jgi:hypothetical protein
MDSLLLLKLEEASGMKVVGVEWMESTSAP